MSSPGEDVVRSLWTAFDEERWDDGVALLATDVTVTMTDSGRVLHGREAVRAFNADYPGRSRCRVMRTHTTDAGLIIGEIEVINDVRGRYWCVGFATVVDGLITDVVEYWSCDESGDTTS